MGKRALNNIRNSYGGLQVLHSAKLDVSDGAFNALAEPSGCGKSALSPIIASPEVATVKGPPVRI